MKRRITITEKQEKAIAAQDQVGGKVNSGLMHYECGICEDSDFELGSETGTVPSYYHVTKGSAAVNENSIDEVSPEEVDLSSFYIKKDLNKKFWKKGKLDPEIRKRLLSIAKSFCKFADIDKYDVDDIIMTGSLSNYNWSDEYSDVDLHIMCDFEELGVNPSIARKYFDSLKNEWNEHHGEIEIYGFNVELYVQDSGEKHMSSGVYSLIDDRWLEIPNRYKLANSKVNKNLIKYFVSVYTEKIDMLENMLENGTKDKSRMERIMSLSEKIINDLKSRRKESLDKTGNEISNGNIIYKALRRMGYIDKIYRIKESSFNKINSLP